VRGLTSSSALLMLHTTSGTPTSVPSSSKNDIYDLDMARQIAKTIVVSSQTFLDSGPRAFKEVSPLVLHTPYKAATVYIQVNRESPSEESLQALETLRASLRVKNRIWNVAGKPSHTLNSFKPKNSL
jgi:hypothetical protein